MFPCCQMTNNKWMVLLIVAGLNFTNAAMWISFAPITNLAATYYKVTNDEINWLSLVFFIATIPLCFLATFLIEKRGLHVGIWIGSLFNILGALLRIASTADLIQFQSIRFPLVMSGQVLAAVAQPFFLIIPTKVSETWFPESYRTVATMISAMANPLGITVSNLFSPYIVTDTTRMPVVNITWGIAGCVFGIAAFFFICSAFQDRLEIQNETLNVKLSYLQQIKQLLCNKDYIIMLITIGGGIGLVSCLSTMLQQMICSKGYSNNYAGICGALLTGTGIVGAGISSFIADKTKKLTEISKVAFVLATFSLIGFAESINFSKNAFPLITMALFGTFAFGAYPVSLELSVECSYPVDEVLSSGLIIISGQIQGVVMIFMTNALGRPISSYDKTIETCSVDGYNDIAPLNMEVSALVLASICIVCTCIYMIFFDPPYKRWMAERQAQVMTGSHEDLSKDHNNAPT